MNAHPVRGGLFFPCRLAGWLLSIEVLGLPSPQSSSALNASRIDQPKPAYDSIERQRISGLHRAKEPAPLNTADAVLKEVSFPCSLTVVLQLPAPLPT
jgi:hypothetical protein